MPRYFTLAESEQLASRGGARSSRRAVSQGRVSEGGSGAGRQRRSAFACPAARASTAERIWPCARAATPAAAALKDALEQIEQIGALVKDLDIGLIDFLTPLSRPRCMPVLEARRGSYRLLARHGGRISRPQADRRRISARAIAARRRTDERGSELTLLAPGPR